jgi:O-antigen ligase
VTFGYSRLWIDNFYLQLGAEGGLLLLAFFLWILLRAAKGLVKGYSANRDPYLRALTAGVFGGFVAVATANATASVWETLAVGVGFWFMTGFASAAALQIPEEAAAASPGAGVGEDRA